MTILVVSFHKYPLSSKTITKDSLITRDTLTHIQNMNYKSQYTHIVKHWNGQLHQYKKNKKNSEPLDIATSCGHDQILSNQIASIIKIKPSNNFFFFFF